jgi:hypothetical protein
MRESDAGERDANGNPVGKNKETAAEKKETKGTPDSKK